MGSMNEIEWFEDDKVKGRQYGLTVDFINNKIIKWNGIEESISESNMDDIRWCIDMNLKYLSQRHIKIITKLKQTKTVYTKIEGGYKMSETLTETQREKYEKLVDEINSETMEYVILKEKYK
jgi:hypothetical protein